MLVREELNSRSRQLSRLADDKKNSLNEVLSKIESLVTQSSSLAIYSFDNQGVVADWNLACQKFYGYTEDEIVGKTKQDVLLIGEAKTNFEIRLDDLIKNKRACVSEEKQVCTKDGVKLWVKSVLLPVCENENLKSVLCVDIDITGQKNAEFKVKDSEQKYRMLLETIPYGIQQLDLEGNILFANSSLHKIYGYNDGELIGKSIFDLVDSNSEKKKLRDYFVLHKDGQLLNIPYESKRITKDSRVIDVSVRWNYKRDLDGVVERIICAITDITRQKKIEKALRSSEDLFRNVVANIPGAVYQCAMDSDYTMKFLSQPIKDITGYPAESFILNRVRSFASIIHEDDLEMVQRVVEESVNNNQPYVLEYRIIDSWGRIHWVYNKGQGVTGKNGKVVWLDGVVVDITEKRKAK